MTLLVKLMKLCECCSLNIAERGIGGGVLLVVKVIEPHANQLCRDVHVGHSALVGQLLVLRGQKLQQPRNRSRRDGVVVMTRSAA